MGRVRGVPAKARLFVQGRAAHGRVCAYAATRTLSRPPAASARLHAGLEDLQVEVGRAFLHRRAQDAPAVARPEIAANRARSVRRDGARLRKGFVNLFYPDIPRAFVRLDKRHKFAVGRKLCAGYFGVAKENFTVNNWRCLYRSCLCRSRLRGCYRSDRCFFLR